MRAKRTACDCRNEVETRSFPRSFCFFLAICPLAKIKLRIFAFFFPKSFAGSDKLCTFALAKQKRPVGALVQLVRIHACHAWGHGFESRTHRISIWFAKKQSKVLLKQKKVVTLQPLSRGQRFSKYERQGRLAQLVQSICLTSRGSAVRIRQRPLSESKKMKLVSLICRATKGEEKSSQRPLKQTMAR